METSKLLYRNSRRGGAGISCDETGDDEYVKFVARTARPPAGSRLFFRRLARALNRASALHRFYLRFHCPIMISRLPVG